MILLAAVIALNFSPADSSRRLLSIAEIPDRAVLFAELAAREGGRPAVDLGTVLELSGRFTEARNIYEAALHSAEDPLLADWLMNRLSGTMELDTMLLLAATVTNGSDLTVEDVRVEIPLPVSHLPYQSIEIIVGAFTAEGDRMTCSVRELPPRSTVVLPLLLRVSQRPWTFRPLPGTFEGVRGSVDLDEMVILLNSIEVPPDGPGPGPCLHVARSLREAAAGSGLDMGVTGGLLREHDGTLLFHAWNHIRPAGIPVDVSLFHADSLRGIGHCPTDLLPLWDLLPTGGHEVSAYYAHPEADLSVSMTASFCDPLIMRTLLDMFPLSIVTER